MTADRTDTAGEAGLAALHEIFARFGRPFADLVAVDLGDDAETARLDREIATPALRLPADLTAAALAARLAELPRAPDLVACDLGDLDDARLDALLEPTRRPDVLRLRGSGSLPQSIADRLTAARRLIVTHPAGGFLAIDARIAATGPTTAPPAPAADDGRPRLKTFDVFDTLIARRCLEPWRIFAALGERAGISDFVERRRAAESRVAGRPYTLDDVYAELGRDLGLEADVVDMLKKLEIELELDAVIPVAQNLAEVSDGDLLVSDMYLPAEVIRALVGRAGLSRQVGLVVTAAGKHHGWIWEKLAARIAIVEHLGDNAHSDVASPKRAGLSARHTTVTALQPVEKLLADRGLRDLALAARETRLATWTADTRLRKLQLIQAGLNFPLLFLSSIALARRALAFGLPRVLFSARDCNLWVSAFEEVTRRTGTPVEARYLLTSRLARMRASPDYLAYVAESLAPGAIVADVCGTGASLARMVERLGRRDQETFFVHRIRPEAAGVEAPAAGMLRLAALVGPEHGEYDSRYVEMANYAEHGMVADVVAIEGAFAPLLAPDDRDAATLAAVAEQRRTFARAVEISRAHHLDDAFGLDDAALAAVCRELYAILARQKVLFEVFAPSHLAEDARVVAERRRLVAQG